MFKKLYAFWLLRKIQKYLDDPDSSKVQAKFDRIFQISSQYHFAYFHFARYWAMHNQLDQAQVYIAKAIALAPKNPIYYTFLGVVLYQQKKIPDAITALQTAISFDSKNQLTQNYLALCRLENGEVPEFKKIIQSVGIFESTQLQIQMLWALEKYQKNIPLTT